MKKKTAKPKKMNEIQKLVCLLTDCINGNSSLGVDTYYLENLMELPNLHYINENLEKIADSLERIERKMK